LQEYFVRFITIDKHNTTETMGQPGADSQCGGFWSDANMTRVLDEVTETPAAQSAAPSVTCLPAKRTSLTANQSTTWNDFPLSQTL